MTKDTPTKGLRDVLLKFKVPNDSRGYLVHSIMLEQAINDYVLGIIGKDRVGEDDSGGKYKVNKYIVAENRLRREQRKRLEM